MPMRHALLIFTFGLVVGGLGVGAIVVAAGDPYEYATLRDYPCEQIKTGHLPTPTTVVPGQDNPCFVRYARYARWLP